MSVDLGELYAASRHRITDLVMSSPADAFGMPCPATPEWNVHDVVAHLRGITEDTRTGNLDGVATDPWTAAQVARHRDTSISELLAGWSQDAPLLESFLSSPAGGGAARAVIDVHTHEADLRSALGRVAPLPDEFARWAMPALTEGFLASAAAAGLPSLRIVTDEGDEMGSDDADVTLRVGRYELFRAVLGRRSIAQVAAFDWGGADGAAFAAHLFVFGPRELDLTE